jgi:hypothetical protein
MAKDHAWDDAQRSYAMDSSRREIVSSSRFGAYLRGFSPVEKRIVMRVVRAASRSPLRRETIFDEDHGTARCIVITSATSKVRGHRPTQRIAGGQI